MIKSINENKEKLKSLYELNIMIFNSIARRYYDSRRGYEQTKTIDEAYFLGKIKAYEEIFGL